jgi:hypothetical protein
MEFIELIVRLPVPSRHWFRFSVKSLLLLTLFVAVICAAWQAHRSSEPRRLLQQIENLKTAQDNAIGNWKLASANLKSGGIANRREEAVSRAQYFESRKALENARQQLARYAGRAEN